MFHYYSGDPRRIARNAEGHHASLGLEMVRWAVENGFRTWSFGPNRNDPRNKIVDWVALGESKSFRQSGDAVGEEWEDMKMLLMTVPYGDGFRACEGDWEEFNRRGLKAA